MTSNRSFVKNTCVVYDDVCDVCDMNLKICDVNHKIVTYFYSFSKYMCCVRGVWLVCVLYHRLRRVLRAHPTQIATMIAVDVVAFPHTRRYNMAMAMVHSYIVCV